MSNNRGDAVLARNELFSAMDNDKPFACYIKTILGKVRVAMWDNFTERPIDVILEGDPKKKDAGCIVKVFSERENSFFKRMNASHFKKGTLISYTLPEDTVVEKTIEQSTDEELRTIVNSRFLALTNKLNSIESVPVLFRMLNIAEEEEKSEKITRAIQARISELQTAEYIQTPETEEE